MILVDFLSTLGTPDIGFTMLLKFVYDEENTPPLPLVATLDVRFHHFEVSRHPIATRDDPGKAKRERTLDWPAVGVIPFISQA
jgi:hypothetical protein